MRILVLTVGTRGDVQPYVALAVGLTKAGHEVQICTCQIFEEFIRSQGIDYAPLNNDIRDFMESEDGRVAMETTTNLFQAVRVGVRLMPKLTGMMHRQVSEMWAAADAFQPDLILFHKKAIGAEDFAERLGCRCALAFYLPLYVPTGQSPAFGFPRLPLGRWYNLATYRVIEFITRRSGGRFVGKWRRSQRMSKKRPPYFRHADGSPVAALHAYSPSVIPRPSDWPDHATVTGYWFLDGATEFTPDPRLVDFLQQGPPPLYVGFGSIFGRDPRATAERVIEAVRLSGQRAILAPGWGGMDLREFNLPETMLSIDAVPHDWLFPQVSAVVHHGGCGTTAAGLRAGRRTIICPFFGDQPFWGRVVHELGVGPKPIPQRRLTPERLAKAISETIDDCEMESRAEQLGKRIRSESGVQNAVRFIDGLNV
ncbi:glycosyltransferase [Rhodopirellula baltica]|uniref:Glycosyl transferase family protein n=1 Tax=Rhodopirellula baltica SWK14 TaxID=993516 RepID=L7CBD8_RHOBT|nr:glycosyltransferase [Rhodopirellula baltica]ELP31160.1 glycosyl transferase family protein [Rhodopirellula baltica SWK14]